jgi:hypothetical protein
VSASAPVPPPPAAAALAPLRALAAVLIVAGLAGFAWLMITGQPTRAWAGVLMGSMLPAWVAVGALFFIAAHSLGGAHWTVPIRRVAEGLTSGLPAVTVGCLLLFALGAPYLYEWAFPGADRDALFHHGAHSSKAAWMTPLRWGATTAAILAIWFVLRGGLVGLSLRQDRGADVDAAHRRWSVAFLILGALTFTLFTWDHLLALDLRAVSSIWGIYCFTGAVQTFLAALVLALLWFRRGPLAGHLRDHTLRDLGTWSLAWGCIVAYATFCQYIIIYFASIPEEHGWMVLRTSGGYGLGYAIEAALRCAVPFAVLMSQSLRAHPAALAVAALAALAGNALDLAWTVVPGLGAQPGQLPLVGPELLVAAAFAGFLILFAAGFWARHGLLPVGDPRLAGAVAGEHLH